MNSIQHRSYKKHKINAIYFQLADKQHELQFKSSRSICTTKALIFSS